MQAIIIGAIIRVVPIVKARYTANYIQVPIIETLHDCSEYRVAFGEYRVNSYLQPRYVISIVSGEIH